MVATSLSRLRPETTATTIIGRAGIHSYFKQSLTINTCSETSALVGQAASTTPEYLQILLCTERRKKARFWDQAKCAKLTAAEFQLFLSATLRIRILLQWLMKPYQPSADLDEDKRRFNFRISSARMVVENAFGRLKASKTLSDD